MNYKSLPIYLHKQRIIDILSQNQVIVVESPTGSGKTTQLPIILYEAGFAQNGVIGITQPRRIATVGVSAFIEKQLKADVGGTEPLGASGENISMNEGDQPASAENINPRPSEQAPQPSPSPAREQSPPEVAYKIRFMDNTTPQTRIKLMTDGILLQEIKADPYLSRYSVIMIDEAHERSLNIDFILGLLKHSIQERSHLKIIISSATIRAELFSEYFDNAPIVRIDTKIYPVSTLYSPPAVPFDNDLLIDKIIGIVRHVLSEGSGDILIFLSGEKTIKDCVRALHAEPYSRSIVVIPLYGRLSKEEQDEVFPPVEAGKTKIVVATNIAETSITIDGIETVIDSGLAKINFHNYRNYTSSLQEKRISKASANQRRGRAGRTAPGRCYRLYSPKDYEHSEDFTEEEIYRRDLSEVVLRMADIGIRNFDSFNFISSPGKAGIRAAVQMLLDLRALEADRSLSSIGRLMTAFPLLPRHSRIIVESMYSYPDVLAEVIIAVSFISASSPFLLPPGEEDASRSAHQSFMDKHGDFVSYIRIYCAYLQAEGKKEREAFCERFYLDTEVMFEILNIVEQLGDIVRERGLFVGEPRLPLQGERLAQFISCMAQGLLHFICKRRDRHSYQSLFGDKRIDIHPGSLFFGMKANLPDLIVAGEIVQTSRTFARSVSPISKDILPRVDSKLYNRYVKSNKKSTKNKSNKHHSNKHKSIKHNADRYKSTKHRSKSKLKQRNSKKV